MTRRQFLGTAAAAGTAATLPLAQAEDTLEAGGRPNVVLVLVDDLGYGDLGCYGAPDLRTPNIDGLMADGVRFTQFYANCPVCSPTRASILTGRYPDLVGVPGVIRTHRDNSWGWLAPDAVLLPRILGEAGYHSAIVGKWHLGLESPNTPTERGFDFFHGFLGDMMDDYYTHLRHENNYMRRNRDVIEPQGHATDLFTDWAIDYIRERAEQPEPFFLYLAYNAPHTPIQPPEEWVARVTAREPGMDPQRAKLAALIEHMDDGVGRVLAALDDTGVAGDTLVIFTSDNGGQADAGARNVPWHGAKQEMFEGGVRVPFGARWPGRIPPGTESPSIGMSMDLFPTLCALCGASFDHEIDGASIVPALLGETVNGLGTRTLFWVRREGGARYGGRAYYAAREGDWKLVQNTPFEPPSLYNLATDPAEEHPVEDKPDVYRLLFKALQDHINRAGAVPWEPDAEPFQR